MGNSFKISKPSVQGLGSGLQNGTFSVEKDLALVKNDNRSWQLINLKQESLPPSSAKDSPTTTLKGSELSTLMYSVANGEPHLPPGLPPIIDERDYKILSSDSKFKTLTHLVPGMETPEHAASRSRTTEATQRIYDSAKVIGKGAPAIEAKGLAPRFVGQDQEPHNYWIREVVYSDPAKPQREVDILVSAWSEDKSSHMSLKEWTNIKQNEWQQLNPGKPFLTWIAQDTYSKKERAAFDSAHKGQPFDQKTFDAWKKSEEDPILILPTWLLKELSGKTTDADFQAWRSDVITDRKKGYEEFIKDAGITNLSFVEHERLCFEYDSSGAVETAERWMLKKLWEDAKNDPINPTKDDFLTYARRLQFKRDFPTSTNEQDFQAWMKAQEQKTLDRYKGSGLPISFEQWKAQQDDDFLYDPAPFILLNSEQRKIYSTTIKQGAMIRNGQPFNTGFDKTRHSGSGYAIFVIGPNDDLYCGSHIGGVFHHSSFLSEGATAAAGEIKTDANGKVIELSSKSGHYQPTDAQNLYMLRYFSDRGIDLTNVDFSFFTRNGNEKHNALDYLNMLEYKESMGGLDSIDPTVF